MGKDSRQAVYAVLTGDLIDSTSLEMQSREEARRLVLSSVNELNGWLPRKKVVYGEADIFRGDQWQALLAQPKFAFRAVLFIRAKLIAMDFDTRISIGIGSVDRISRPKVSMSDGDAFLRSGHGLDEMNTESELAISLPDGMDEIGDWLSIVAELSGAILTDWSKRQAEVVSLAIDPQELSQKEIGQRLERVASHQMVSKTLKAAKWGPLRDAITTFERFDWEGLLSDQPRDLPRRRG